MFDVHGLCVGFHAYHHPTACACWFPYHRADSSKNPPDSQ
jgi:hypothetical protein